MREYEKQDKVEPPRKGAILFLGGAQFKDWEPIGQDFPPSLTIIGRGFPGWSMEDAIRFVERTSIVYQPRVIVLQAGRADLGRGRTPEDVVMLFQQYVAAVRAKLPRTRILFLSLMPTFQAPQKRAPSLRVNQLISEYVPTAENLGFIDVWSSMSLPNGDTRTELFLTDSYKLTREGVLLRAKVILSHLQ